MGALYVAVFSLSAATLIFEISLTRVFSVAQWYHFAFMIVSLALLGFGASGTLMTLFPQLLRRDLASLLTTLCLVLSLSVVGSYLISNHVPFDSFQIAYDWRQLIYLAIYYLSLAIPFFFTGLGVGLVLAAYPARSGKVYAANLTGSGLGCLLALGVLSVVGGEGAIVVAALWGALAAAGLAYSRSRVRFVLALVMAASLAALLVQPPAVLETTMSPYKALSHALRYPGARIALQGSNAFSRVDVVESDGIRSAPGLSYAFSRQPPAQKGVFTDGEDLSPLTAASQGTDLSFLDSLLVSLPYQLLPRSRVLILEPGAGLDVLLAVQKGAAGVVAVDSNPLVISVVRDRYGEFAGNLYSLGQVTVVAEDGRSYVRRSDERFDIIQISLADGYRPVASGAYSLSENYLYTTDAFVDYLNHLSPGGILAVERWLQTPPSESVRSLTLALSALETMGVERPAEHLVALRSLYNALLLVKENAFTSQEIETVRSFSREHRFDLVYFPGIQLEEVNRYSVLEEPYYYSTFLSVLETDDRAGLFATYPFDITPPSDDRPFFFHFFRWQQTPQIIRTLGKTWQPFGGSGYFVLLALFVLALFASLILILLPLSFLRSRGEIRHGRRLFLYFLLLGVAYLFVEIPLVQRFILFLGHPVYAFAAVLFSLLTFSGLGSLVSPKLSLRKVLAALVIALACYPFLLPHLFGWFLGAVLALRLLASVIMLAPLGFLMGVPFPKGIRLAAAMAPNLVPWAWGVNGCASVLSSILAVIIAISYGFSWVLIGGGVAYALSLGAMFAVSANSAPVRGGEGSALCG